MCLYIIYIYTSAHGTAPQPLHPKRKAEPEAEGEVIAQSPEEEPGKSRAMDPGDPLEKW